MEDSLLPHQVFCPRCKRLITLPSVEVGSREQCPHCEIDFVVSSSMMPPADGKASEDDVYGLKIDTGPKAPRSIMLSDSNESEEVEGEGESELEEAAPSWRPMHAPPPGIFLGKTFTFPFRGRSSICLIVLLTLSLVMGLIVFQMLEYINYVGIFGLLYSVATVLLGAVSLLVFSTFGLAILRDTFDGFDKIVSWPWSWHADFLGESGYVLIALFWGCVPALLVTALPGVGDHKIAAIIFSEMILFPLFLLSAMESKSAVMLYSRPVWRSLWYAWHGWALFYLLTLLIVVLFAFFMKLDFVEAIWAKILVVCIFAPYYCLVYFRLLGRLAWFCSGRFEEEGFRGRGSGIRIQGSEVGDSVEDEDIAN